MNSDSTSVQPAPVVRLACDDIPTLLCHNPAHEVVAARLYVRGGASRLDVRHAGADALYARAARRGTRHFPKHELNAALANMGTDIGAASGEDWTVYHLRCVRRHFESSWKIFTDIVVHPLLADDEVELVRRQMLVEIRQRHDDPDGRLDDLGRELAFAGHPYAAHPAGTEESVRDLGVDTLRAHAAAQLTQRNLLLVVSGDVARDELERLVGLTLTSLPAGDGAATTAPPLRFERGRLRVESRELPTNYILGQFAAPGLDAETHAATLLAMSVLRDRLFEEVRTKRNLSYAPAAGLGSHAANHGWIYVTAVDPATTMRVMLDEMRGLRDRPLEPKEMHDKVQVYITRYYLQNETNQAQAAFLGRYELLGRGWERSRDFVTRLEALSPADVQQAARDVLRNIQYVYLGDPELATPDVFVDP